MINVVIKRKKKKSESKKGIPQSWKISPLTYLEQLPQYLF